MKKTARRRVLVIYNPTAGRRRTALLNATLAALEGAGAQPRLRPTSERGDAEAFAREASPERWDAVVAAGGDGTINEVVNGLAGSSVPMGIIPLGTANVLAREIGLPAAPEELARTIVGGVSRGVRVGSVDGRLFSIMAGLGFDARVVDGMSLAAKRGVGRWAYGAESVKQVLLPLPPPFEIEVDERRCAAQGAIVCKGRLYGGSFVCAPEADIEKPSFEVVLIRPGGRLTLLQAALALFSGRLARSAAAHVVTATRVCAVEPRGAPIQADGDVVGRTPARITIDPRPLLLLAPSSPGRRGR